MRRSFALALTLGGVAVIGVPAAMAKNNLDRTKLVVGKTSTSAQRDRLWSCQSSFSSNAPGAFKDGPWLNSDGTWDMTKKVTVDGSTKWPNANLSVSVSGADRVIMGNALPINGATGTYPVASTDDAYNYDRNPNTIRAQTISVKIPAQPKVNATPQCVGGEVGISLDGPAIFSSIDAGGRDAQAYEIQDVCSGHPERTGTYHYHGLSACSDKTRQFGWSLDGFAIWGSVDPATGIEWTNDELDECHGVTSEITLDGKKVTTYHYVANDQYPYTVGCYRGTPSARSAADTGGQPGAQQTGGGAGAGAPTSAVTTPATTSVPTTKANTTKATTTKDTTTKKTTAKRRTSATRAR